MVVAQRYPPSHDRPLVLDVGARRLDVVHMARSHDVWRTCIALGWDPDDLEQEVLLRAHRRQSMPSRYDPRRAGLGKYLFVLTRGILLNLVEMRQTERVQSEQLGQGRDAAIDAALAAWGEE